MTGFPLIIKPDETDDEAAEILVDGTVDGRPYRFLLDTGAARTHLRHDAYTAVFPRVGVDTSSGVFASGSDDLITVPSVTLGPISRSDFTIVRLAEQGPERRSLIGMDLLKDTCCHFLFDEGRVVVDPDNMDAIPFQDLFLDQRFHPYVDVLLGETTARCVWDTGGGITVADTSFIERLPASFQPIGDTTGTDSKGAEQETPMYRMAATIIGGQLFSPHTVAGVDLARVNATLEVPMDLILGYSTLSKANWLFDFPRRRWAITKPPG
jgi:hypothetical protein